MSIYYGVISLIAALLLVTYFIVDKKRDTWLMLLFISILICNTGYFLLSMATNLTFALISNSVAYIGNVFLPFFMLMMIFNVCHIKYSKKLIITLVVVGLIMCFIATSGGYLPIYYKEVSLQLTDGIYKLVKEYGPLHIVYLFYLVGYFGSMVAMIIYSIIKSKQKSKMHAVFLSVIVMGNLLVWLIERFVPNEFEFLSISYIISEILLLLLYAMLQEYGLVINNKLPEIEDNSAQVDVEQFFTAEQIDSIFLNYKKISNLTVREKEVLRLILCGTKRKDIAVELFITDSAVKNHTTNIFKKLKVENRNQLYKQVKKYY